ncbi:YtxH domain-containing protein [Flavobacterium azooxidireducens]|jgi:gas vesicle protein|uniref:YtxH domain-containing protein n=1 Tax=Flavobacterium azooxidireducens TaxID=1871076 RepID=A0ABY4KGX1_9FLAO|nr:YtxH domain-containing protein [Flavobacterium azooxidireducens]UPQ79620.1 YtxH domain-containing protein [Flavobacterium azooxidireducens]
MKASNVVLGVLGGLAAGAILGVLFAPDKGENTRKKIAKKSGDLKDTVKSSFNDFLTSVEDQYHSLTSKAEDVAQNVANEGKANLEKINRELNK